MDVQTLWHMFMASALGIALLQKLKSAKWFPWAEMVGTKTMNRVFGIAISLLGVTGVHYAWTLAPDGSHTLMLTNISLWGIANATWHWFQQWIMQETVYQMSLNRLPAQVGVTGTIVGGAIKNPNPL